MRKALCWGRGAAEGAPERTAVLMEPGGDWCGASPGRGRPSRQGLWERGPGGGGWIPGALQGCQAVRALFVDANVGKICVCT